MNLLLDIRYGLLPETIVLFTLLISGLLCFLLKKENQKFIYHIVFVGVVLGLTSFGFLSFNEEYNAFLSTFTCNFYTIIFRILVLFGGLISILMSKKYVSGFGVSIGEFYTLLLTAILGAMLLSGANDMTMIFIGMETLTISSYALCGFTKNDKLSNEAALKYLIIGGASSALLLWGFSFLYGITGDTNLFNMSSFFITTGYKVNAVLLFSFILVLTGFGFKLSSFPVYNWAPDVYQGAPVPVAAFLSVVSKIAGFAVIIRFMTMVFANIPIWQLTIAILAIFTMTLGNLMAINQNNVRRLMAYSSISQAGYILAGLALLTKYGISGMIFYLITYLFMNFGTWIAIEMLINKTGRENIEDFNGLATKQPYVAFGLMIGLLSLAGIPITSGFFAKFYLFQSIVMAGNQFIWLLFIALINTIVAVYYYLKIVKAMYLRPLAQSNTDKYLIADSFTLKVVLTVMSIAVLVIGIFSSPFIQLSEKSASYVSKYIDDFSALQK